MTKNYKGGKKTKKIAKKRQAEAENIPFITKDINGGQEYAKVIKSFGGAPPMLNLECYDKKERLGVITGKLRKKIFCNKDDIVLVNLRDYQDSKCDVIWKYSEKDIKQLIKENEINGTFVGIQSSNDIYNNFDSVFEFDYSLNPEMEEQKETETPKIEYETIYENMDFDEPSYDEI